MNTNKVTTLDIHAKEWFDKVNGNSYFSARATINYGTQDEQTVYIPFEYGYGSFYEQKTREVLVEMGLIENVSFYELREGRVIIRSHKESKCKKSEVKQFGQK